MATEILMPALAPDMEAGKLSRWLVAAGDRVAAGDVICEIETDKAAVEYEAEASGVLTRILAPEGAAGVKVGAPIALLETGEEATPPAPVAAPPAGADRAGARILASPLARRLAKERGVDLSTLEGSGPGGRIVKADVAAANGASASGAPDPAPLPRQPAAAPCSETVATDAVVQEGLPTLRLRRRIAVDRLLQLQAEMNAPMAGRAQPVPLSAFYARACALALASVGPFSSGSEAPKLSAIRLSDGAGGGAQLTNAAARSVTDIAAEIAAHAASPDDAQPTDVPALTILDLGAHGVETVEPAVSANTPVVLGLGAPGTHLHAVLAVDATRIEAAAAARLLAAIAERLEAPGCVLG